MNKKEKYKLAVELFNNGKNVSLISKEINFPLNTLIRWLEKDGLYKSKTIKQISNNDKEQIIKLRNQGLSIKNISNQLNLTEYIINKVVKEFCPNAKAIKQVNRSNSDAVKYELNTNYFNELNPESAYWLGFIFADGSLQKHRLTIRLASKDIEHLNKFKKCLNFNGNIVEKTNNTNYKNNSSMAYLEINSVELIRSLKKYLPIGKKSDSISIPNIDNELIPHFIRGYFDDDGFVVKNRRQIGFCGNMEFINELKNQFIKFGLVSEKDGWIRTYKNPIYGELRYSKIKSKEIMDWMFKDADLYLERKFNDFYNPQ